jgi:hypothetical protein
MGIVIVASEDELEAEEDAQYRCTRSRQRLGTPRAFASFHL